MSKTRESERLRFRALSEDDIEAMYALLSDPQVVRYIGRGIPLTRTQTQQVLEKAILHHQKHGFGLMAVIEKASDKFIGWGGLICLGYDDNATDIEVLYALLPAYWGKGYATEIADFMIKWGFSDLPVNHLVAVASLENQGSRNVLTKAGMHFIREDLYCGQPKAYYQINLQTDQISQKA